MKKLILCVAMMIAETISSMLLLSGAMSQDKTINGKRSVFWNLSEFGLIPAFIIFIITVVGLLISIWSIVSKTS